MHTLHHHPLTSQLSAAASISVDSPTIASSGAPPSPAAVKKMNYHQENVCKTIFAQDGERLGTKQHPLCTVRNKVKEL